MSCCSSTGRWSGSPMPCPRNWRASSRSTRSTCPPSKPGCGRCARSSRTGSATSRSPDAMIATAARSRRPELPAAVAVTRLLAAAVAAALAAVLLAACAGLPPSRAPASGVGFLISQRDSLYDVPLDIRVTGLRPGERVTVGLSATNEVGSRWSARATFVARGQVLDIAATAPVAGSYRGVAGMGLFEPMRNRRFVSYFGPRNPQPFTLTAVIRGRLAATATLVRELTSAGVRCVQQTAVAAGFFGSYCAPAGRAARRPAVLIFGGSEGGLAVADLAGLLASHGYPALALAYFGAPGLPANLVRIPLEYFARAARWLRRTAGAAPASAGTATATPGGPAGSPRGTGS